MPGLDPRTPAVAHSTPLRTTQLALQTEAACRQEPGENMQGSMKISISYSHDIDSDSFTESTYHGLIILHYVRVKYRRYRNSQASLDQSVQAPRSECRCLAENFLFPRRLHAFPPDCLPTRISLLFLEISPASLTKSSPETSIHECQMIITTLLCGHYTRSPTRMYMDTLKPVFTTYYLIIPNTTLSLE